MDRWVGGWVDECQGEQIESRCVTEYIHLMEGWMDGWMDGWVDECQGEQTERVDVSQSRYI